MPGDFGVPGLNLDEIGKHRESSTTGEDVSFLHCHGCAHSAATEPAPGKPSGERPCFFCVRNPDHEQWQKNFEKDHGEKLLEWYDGSPIAFYPMDAYTTLDMTEQGERWRRKAEGDPNWNEPKGGVRFG